MKELIKNALILFAISLIGTTLLAVAYQVTKEPIRIQQEKKTAEANMAVMQDVDFEVLEDVDFSDYDKIQEIFVAKKSDEIAGYTFKLKTDDGYSAGLEAIVGISIEGKVTGVDIIASSETPGLGLKADDDEFKGQYSGKPISELTVVKGTSANENEISAIGGATITSKAVNGVVNEAINFYNNELSKEGK